MPTGVQVLILYEDRGSGLWAKTLLNRALYDVHPRVAPMIKIWRFDLMDEPMWRAAAVREALAAQVVIVAARCREELPAGVRAWMRTWLESREPTPCALVGVFENREGRRPDDDWDECLWRRAAADRSLGLFLHAWEPEEVESVVARS